MKERPKRPLKILVLTSTYARDEGDAQVPWMRETVNRLIRLGHQVEVLAPSYKGLASHEIDGVKVRRFRYAPKSLETLTHDAGAPNKVRKPLVKLLTVPYLIAGFFATTWRLLRMRPDVIKVHWPFPHALMAWAGAKLTRAKMVSVCHGAELAIVRSSGILRRVLSWLLRRSDLVACNSSHTLGQIRSLPKSDFRVEIVPYGSTVGGTGDSPEPSETASEEDPLILSCGRVIERKGLPYLIEAMPLILEKHPGARLVMTGDGDKREECEKLIEEKGLSGSVTMAGFVSTEELGALYRTCDVYAHPSIIDSRGDTEGLGVVLVEALANRRPVVASAVGGIVDVIKAGTSGILVPEKDVPALAGAITGLLDDPEAAEALGERGYQFALEHFSWDRIVARLSGLLEDVVGIPKKAGRTSPADGSAAADTCSAS